MFRNKRGQFLKGKVWQKYENARRKHLKVELTADTEYAAKKLQTLGEVGVADRCVKARETLSCAVSGRRIVELDVLAKGLDDGCMLCRAPLSLSNVCEEYRRGLGSTLFILCKCGCSTAVKTGKQHADSSKKKLLPIYDVNTKLTCFKYYS